ncbi:MAG TPA: hypothetical protein VGN42_01135 [Pirellulales bacterium]|nr:hypothetical protein [Pirellulales bacterium]
MRAGSLQSRTLAAALAIVCSPAGLTAQEAPDNMQQAADAASVPAARPDEQNDSEIAELRGEIQALRKDVTRLLVLLESHSAANPATARPAASPRTQSTARLAQEKRSAAKSELYAVTYATADLIMPIGKTVPLASSKAAQNEPSEPIEPDFDSLIEFIQSRVRPESWEINGGPGKIQKYPNNLALVISQTPQVHAEIAALLAALRKAADRQIALETKILTFDKEPAGQNPKLDGKAAILTAPRAKLLTEIAQEDRRANIYQAPNLTLFSGQTANLRLDDSPADALDLLINAVWNEDRHSVRLRVAVNAKNEYDVLRSSDSLDVAEGQSVLIDLSSEGGAVGNSDSLISIFMRGGSVPPAANAAAGRTGKRLLMVTPRIIVVEEEEEVSDIPTHP